MRLGGSGIRTRGGCAAQARGIMQELGGITELGDVKHRQPASAEEAGSQLKMDRFYKIHFKNIGDFCHLPKIHFHCTAKVSYV